MGFTYKAKFRYHWALGPIVKSGIDIPVLTAHVSGTSKAVDFRSNRDISIYSGLDAARRAKGIELIFPSTSGAPPGDKSVLTKNQAFDDLSGLNDVGAEFLFSFSILKYSNGTWIEAQILRDDAASCKYSLISGLRLGMGFRLPSAKIINASPTAADLFQSAVDGVFLEK